MKHFLALLSLLVFPTMLFALDKLVSIEGPVRIIETEPSGNTYLLETPEKTQYKVVVPASESERFSMIIKDEPSAVVRFDGTVVNDEAVPVFNVQRWQKVVETKSSTDKFGNTVTERKTILEKR